MAPSGNACAAMAGTPVMTSMAECALCCQYFAAEGMKLFLMKNKSLQHAEDRAWELKCGVRHICQSCISVVAAERD